MLHREALTDTGSRSAAARQGGEAMKIDLEAEYNNRARVPGHPETIAGWARDAAAYRAEAGKRLSVIDYGLSERQYIDVFAPERPNPDALPVLFIHGGYWQALDPSFFSHMARGLNAHGVTVGVAGYDLCPQVSVGEIAAQMRRAASAFVASLAVPGYVATGHSAGGHLAACLAAEGAAAGLAISGLFDLEPLVPTSINQKLGLTAEEARAQSPRLLHPPAGLRFDCCVGGHESSEYLRQSRTMAAIWAGCGADTAYVEIPGANHFTVIAGLAEARSDLTLRLSAISGKLQA
jgi:arylformamidase